MAPGWVVGIEVSYQDCVPVAGEQVIEGTQVRYASMCKSPVAADDAGFLSVDGCGDVLSLDLGRKIYYHNLEGGGVW